MNLVFVTQPISLDAIQVSVMLFALTKDLDCQVGTCPLGIGTAKEVELYELGNQRKSYK
jgi:hypothetical protein